MKEKLEQKIDNLIKVIDDDSRLKKIDELRDKLLSDNDLLSKISKLKELDKYSNEYKELKQELYNNSDFVSYKELENEINYLILEINNKLSTLTNERRCSNAYN